MQAPVAGKPKRAKLNGIVKDWLLNDCLSDAMIYEGDSHPAMRDAMVDTVSRVIDANPNDAGTLVVVAQSLGSKMLFDALSAMLESDQPHTRELGQQAAPRSGPISRLGVVAFTDPNDLLSYRLLPARYAAPEVAVADVLVSNARAWPGLIENPLTAHMNYLDNPDVDALIACGYPKLAGCR